MSNLPQNEFDDSDLEGLSPSVKHYVYEGPDQFSRIFRLEKDRCLRSMPNAVETPTNPVTTTGSLSTKVQAETEINEYFVLSIDASTFERDFADDGIDIPHIVSSEYSAQKSRLVIKMPNPVHNQVGIALHGAIKTALVPMRLHNMVFSWGTVNVDVGSGRMKQADMGWGPRRCSPGTPKKPTVVLEAGVSESHKRLFHDMETWLNPHKGNVRMALSIKVVRNRRKLTIEKWVWDATNRIPSKVQGIVLERNETGQTTSRGGDLMIPFRDIFLRDTESSRETDITIDTGELQAIAELAWDMQFQDEDEDEE
ncbi:hypothetical protein N7481_006609 [Penicillium waksmanii]|uniref:uncharacterized protein n=1 Tax=Penicillium waksmanii TaxID=69791 RepID=UPI0025486A8D|nr:uncharacterized protein N7481_006609 [Penicillium waksmanii]KAJ5984510.1 hypothetical protein N7481_006609 [Penicillium waksmanii]